MDRDQKAQVVKEIGEELDSASAVFAVDYRGISVTQAAELRVKLSESDASFNVVKNRLAKRATEAAGASDLDEHLVGPTALTYVRGDAVVAAKTISDFVKANGVPTYKGGIMDGGALDASQFASIARLPGVDVLRGQLVGLAASPLTGVVRTLNQLIQGLASQLGQVADKGLVSGEEPAKAEEPAAAEEPPAATAGDEDPDPDAGDPGGSDAPAVDAEPPNEGEADDAPDQPDDDTTSETEADETPDDGDDAGAEDEKED
jgi:large subunit ribosomal protein L10